MASINIPLPTMDTQYEYMEVRRMEVNYGLFAAEVMITGDRTLQNQLRLSEKRLLERKAHVDMCMQIAFN